MSFHFRQLAFELVMKRLPATIELSLGVLAVALIISIPLGIFSAVKQYSYIDQGSLFFALCIMGWVSYARLVRGQILSLKNLDYIQAAVACITNLQHLVFLTQFFCPPER